MNFLRNVARFCLMPGADPFTRRRVRLCRHWTRGERRVLDAGSGNGWFSYLAWKSGATVVAVNFEPRQVKKACAFYNDWLGISQERLNFRKMNLYEIGGLEGGFDEILCYETLEHVKDDGRVCDLFYSLLKPGGVLHLCCPCSEHPRWKREILDESESGGHVRVGYTEISYRTLLESRGFGLKVFEGVGGKSLVRVAGWINRGREWVGDACAIPLVLLGQPWIWLDPVSHACPPYSLYVKAIKNERPPMQA